MCLTLPEGEVHQCNEGHCCCVECWNHLEEPRRCPECRQPAADAGAIEAVVEAMRAYPQMACMQEHACRALASVCFGEDAAGNARKQRAADAGAIEAVVAALRAHPQVARVQECGCGALFDVCASSDEEEALARWRRASQAGGRAATAAAMRAHPRNTELQRLGQRLLGQLPE